MATLQPQPMATAKSTKRKRLHHALKIDMTPMVDLGFLLITFFIFTSTMAEKGVADLMMPKEGPPLALGNSFALTLLLDEEEKVFLYSGNWEEALAQKSIVESSFSNKRFLRSLIKEKQAALGPQKEKLMVLIKASDNSRYGNTIDALDEMLINNVKRYAFVDATPGEKTYLQQFR